MAAKEIKPKYSSKRLTSDLPKTVFATGKNRLTGTRGLAKKSVNEEKAYGYTFKNCLHMGRTAPGPAKLQETFIMILPGRLRLGSGKCFISRTATVGASHWPYSPKGFIKDVHNLRPMELLFHQSPPCFSNTSL